MINRLEEKGYINKEKNIQMYKKLRRNKNTIHKSPNCCRRKQKSPFD